jgi:hypothetical protein
MTDNKWTCADDPNIPAGASTVSSGLAMTVATYSGMLCRGFKFFGVQCGNDCFRGNDYGNQGEKAPESDCGSICTGSPIDICGAPDRNSIYAQPPSMYHNTTTSSH